MFCSLRVLGTGSGKIYVASLVSRCAGVSRDRRNCRSLDTAAYCSSSSPFRLGCSGLSSVSPSVHSVFRFNQHFAVKPEHQTLAPCLLMSRVVLKDSTVLFAPGMKLFFVVLSGAHKCKSPARKSRLLSPERPACRIPSCPHSVLQFCFSFRPNRPSGNRSSPTPMFPTTHSCQLLLPDPELNTTVNSPSLLLSLFATPKS